MVTMADNVENPDASVAVAKNDVEKKDVPKVVEADEKTVESEVVAAVPTENGAVPVLDEDKKEDKTQNRILDEKEHGSSKDVVDVFDVVTGKSALPKKYVFSINFIILS